MVYLAFYKGREKKIIYIIVIHLLLLTVALDLKKYYVQYLIVFLLNPEHYIFTPEKLYQKAKKDFRDETNII